MAKNISVLDSKQDGYYLITPEIARQLLLRNRIEFQRKLKMRVVNSYAQDMKAGLWQKNGEPIHLDSDGRLVNGQHRLRAIIESGVSIELYVIHNVDATLFDSGYRRNLGDQLQMNGVALPTTASAAGKIVAGVFKPVGSGMYSKYTAENKDELQRAYNACCVGTAGRYSKKAAFVAATYLMLRSNTARYFEMEMFWQVFNTKEARLAGAHEASPILVAREMIDDINTSRLQRNEMEIIILAMEDFLADRPRTEMYRLESPFHWEKYMSEVRKADGLE